MADIHSLSGYAAPGCPDQAIVNCLKGLLALAQSGDLRALTFVGLTGYGDNQAPIVPANGEGIIPTLGDARAMIAHVAILQANIVDGVRRAERR